MQTFSAPPVPYDAPQWFIDYANALHQAIYQAAQAGNDSIGGRYLTAEPARPQDGAIYLAEGTEWNPGSGRGAYRYESSSATYVLLG